MASGTAECEEAGTLQFEDLTPHEMNYIVADVLNFSTLPAVDGIFFQQIEILMIPIHPQKRKGLR